MFFPAASSLKPVTKCFGCFLKFTAMSLDLVSAFK